MITRNTLAAAILLALPLLANGLAHAQSTTAPTTPAAASSADPAAATDPAQPVAEGEAEKLEGITVQGKFFDSKAKSAMKMDVSVLETPFSVQSYGEAFIEAIEAKDLGQMFSYMTGVKKAGLTGLDITFRGFKSTGDDQNSVMVDGLPGLAGRFGSPPSIGLQSVELVRGSMSVLYGQNQPGGFINLISKKPEFNYATQLGISGTGYSGHGISLGDRTGVRAEFDTTGRFDDEGTFLYRLIGDFGDKDSFRDYNFDRGKYLAPSVTWNIGAATYLTAQLEYRENTSSFDQGLVAPNRDIRLVAPITTYYSEPDSQREEEGTTKTLFFSHTFANDWVWNSAFRSVDYDSEQKEFSHVGVRPNGITLNRRARHLQTERQYDNFDTNVTMNLETGSIGHKVIVGINGGETTTVEDRLKFFNSVCPGVNCFDINIYNPVYGVAPPFNSIPASNPNTPTNLTKKQAERSNHAFYISDLISFGDHWKLSLAARNFSEKSQVEELRQPNAPIVKKTSKDSFLPMAGLLFMPNDKWTIYGSYSESYVPADPADQDINGVNSFEPLMGEQYEIGAKTEGLMDDRVSASIAVFRIDQTNLMNSFSCPLGVCYNQLGQGRSSGAEFEANVRPTDNWQLTFGYAYTDAKVMASIDPIQVGQQLPNAPRHTANIWSSYSFDSGFGLGVGLSHIGDYQGLVTTTAAPQLMPMPGYTVADIALSYKFDRYALNLKIGNVFDKTYYEGTGLTAPVQIVPGAPRNVTLSLRMNF